MNAVRIKELTDTIYKSNTKYDSIINNAAAAAMNRAAR